MEIKYGKQLPIHEFCFSSQGKLWNIYFVFIAFYHSQISKAGMVMHV